MHKFSKNLGANGNKNVCAQEAHISRYCIKCSYLGVVAPRICATLLCGIEKDYSISYFKGEFGT